METRRRVLRWCAPPGEAFIVHYADEVDSIMNQFHEKERPESWEYDKMLQRYLWKV